MSRSESQSKADKRYATKMANRPRFPGTYLTDEQDSLLCEMAQIYGGKTVAIFKGLELLKASSEDDKGDIGT